MTGDFQKSEHRMERIFLFLGALSAFIGVAAGAFGAHGLTGRISSDMLAVFEVGVRYQMYHAFALIITAWVQTKWPSPMVIAAGWCFAVGTLLFSGSLYLLSLSGLKWLGAITPVGGVAFLAGWVLLALGVLKTRHR